jgi:hypothetical protein
MPENTPNLGIPKPLGNEYFNRSNFNQILDAIDQKAANKETVDNHIKTGNAHGIGDKTTLLTTNKTSIVGALNELFTNVNDGKTQVRNAIIGKGSTVAENPTFQEMANAIGIINTGKKVSYGTQPQINFTGVNYDWVFSGLTFRPKFLRLYLSNGLWVDDYTISQKDWEWSGNVYVKFKNFTDNGWVLNFENNSFQNYVDQFKWIAIGD